MIFNYIVETPTLMLIALIGGWSSITTINEGYTGLVLRGDREVRQLPPGAHYHLPFVERVIRVNTDVSHLRTLTHESSLANEQACAFRVQYGYVFDDVVLGAQTLGYQRSIRYKPAMIEEQIRTQVDDFANRVTLSDLDGSISRNFERDMKSLNHQVFEDGTRADNITLSSIACDDPVATAALEQARRPVFRAGTPVRFEELSACGEAEPETVALDLPTIKVYSRNGIPVDLIGLTMRYKLMDPSSAHPPPQLINALVSTHLRNAFGGIDTADIGTQNLCPIILENVGLERAMARSGIALVALDPNKPQYAIYEDIEYADTPAD